MILSLLRYSNNNNIKKEVITWAVLYYSFKIDMKEILDPNENAEEDNKILNYYKNRLSKLVMKGNKKYPLAYILIYRKFLLDKVIYINLVILYK